MIMEQSFDQHQFASMIISVMLFSLLPSCLIYCYLVETLHCSMCSKNLYIGMSLLHPVQGITWSEYVVLFSITSCPLDKLWPFNFVTPVTCSSRRPPDTCLSRSTSLECWKTIEYEQATIQCFTLHTFGPLATWPGGFWAGRLVDFALVVVVLGG